MPRPSHSSLDAQRIIKGRPFQVGLIVCINVCNCSNQILCLDQGKGILEFQCLSLWNTVILAVIAVKSVKPECATKGFNRSLKFIPCHNSAFDPAIFRVNQMVLCLMCVGYMTSHSNLDDIQEPRVLAILITPLVNSDLLRRTITHWTTPLSNIRILRNFFPGHTSSQHFSGICQADNPRRIGHNCILEQLSQSSRTKHVRFLVY